MTLEELLTPHINPDWTYRMTVGIGPGWEPIVRAMHLKLVAIDPDYTIQQIKEKFGTLRVYAHTANREARLQFNQAVADAEILSGSVCEECGEPGVTANSKHSYWIRTLCGPCRQALAIQREQRDAETREKFPHLFQDEDDE